MPIPPPRVGALAPAHPTACAGLTVCAALTCPRLSARGVIALREVFPVAQGVVDLARRTLGYTNAAPRCGPPHAGTDPSAFGVAHGPAFRARPGGFPQARGRGVAREGGTGQAGSMSVGVTLKGLGGFGTRAQLRRHHSRRAIARAVEMGEIRRPGRDRYVVAEIDAHRVFAHEQCAVLGHLSAALAHGWPVVWVPDLPWLVVVPGRHVTARMRSRTGHLAWAPIDAAERAAGVTSPCRTVLDCARALPRDQGLAIADAALASGKVSVAELERAASKVTGPGARRVRWVLAAADERAANPFESVLRSICLEIDGLSVVPQQTIAEPGLFAVVDLADPELRLVLEADGYEHHGSRAGFVRDVRRHTELSIYGWHVLRFTWVDVMTRPVWVRWTIETWLAVHVRDRALQPPPRGGSVATGRNAVG